MTQHIHEPGDHGYRFCPMCGAPLENRVVGAPDPQERLVCTDCKFIFYLDPKVAVGTLVRGPKGFLLLKRAIKPGYGKWVFPGGYVDRWETVEQAAVREAREEAGIDIRLGNLINIYSYARRGIVLISYEAEAGPGEAKINLESLDLMWSAPDEIPWNDLAFPSTRSTFRDYFRSHGLEKFVPVDFDPGAEF